MKFFLKLIKKNYHSLNKIKNYQIIMIFNEINLIKKEKKFNVNIHQYNKIFLTLIL